MTEKKFKIMLNELLKESGFEQLPHIFYNDEGDEESIFDIKYLRTRSLSGREVVAFAEVFGNVKNGFDLQNNANVVKHICPTAEVRDFLRERLEILDKNGVMDTTDKGAFVSDALDIIISNFKKQNINMTPELMFLISTALSESFEKGEKSAYNKMNRTNFDMEEKVDSVDFSSYVMC